MVWTGNVCVWGGLPQLRWKREKQVSEGGEVLRQREETGWAMKKSVRRPGPALGRYFLSVRTSGRVSGFVPSPCDEKENKSAQRVGIGQRTELDTIRFPCRSQNVRPRARPVVTVGHWRA